jgi:hypothetical protein
VHKVSGKSTATPSIKNQLLDKTSDSPQISPNNENGTSGRNRTAVNNALLAQRPLPLIACGIEQLGASRRASFSYPRLKNAETTMLPSRHLWLRLAF